MFVVKWALLLVKLLHQLVYWTFTGELVVFLTNSTHIGCYYESLKLKTKKSELVVEHTSWNSFNKWTKILSLEIINFELKNDGKKWSRIYFEIH